MAPTQSPPADKSQPWLPLVGGGNDGWSTETEATATCFCGAVQLKFPLQGPGLVETFICHCVDCRKVSVSMFATNFTIADPHLTYIRGRDNITAYGQSRTIATDNTMTNHFCKTCGTLMYRASSGYKGLNFVRMGIVDDYRLHETKLKPRVEQFVEERVEWLRPVEGMKQVEGMWVGSTFQEESKKE
ncbi:Mss4-like protein [Favolaschia claudopus]|uniref:Mss4-like protein n=1 Tax=Favolaschia claudopus TaxID=2862362 RepID=A0AAV9ZLW6_9AGAR